MGYRPDKSVRLSAGLCITCPNERGADGTKSYCRQCADKMRDARRKLDGIEPGDLGTCLTCPAKRDHIRSRQCRSCRKQSSMEGRRSRVRRDWQEAGLCVDCGNPRAGSGLKCAKHLLMCVAHTNMKRSVTWQRLLEIFNSQGGRCHYTGWPIELGTNAELDHLKPKSRFPELALQESNVVFCHVRINAWKGARTDDEFIALCTAVAKHRSATEVGELAIST